MTADVATSLASWSTTAGSNRPDNSDYVGPNILAENLRTIQAVVRNLAATDTIASATTTDLGSKESVFLTVSGTTTITGLGTISTGIYRWVTFSGILTLTHNGTSLILPGATSITTAAGDAGIFLSLGSGNWKCLQYLQNSHPVFNPAAAGALAGVTTINASGQFTSTVASGTPPLVVTSTTQVANLNSETLGGATFANPGPIGTTPSTGAFTTLSASSNFAINTNKFTVDSSTGNAVMAGTVTGNGSVDMTPNRTIAASTACTGALTNSISYRVSRVGGQVVLTVPDITGTTAAAASIALGVVLPAEYRPFTTQNLSIITMDNNLSNTTAGLLQVSASTGQITIYHDNRAATNWGTAANSGVNSQSFSWTL